MNAQTTISQHNNREISRTALIFGGIVVAIIVIPFLMRAAGVEMNFSTLPNLNQATMQLAQQATSLPVESFKTLVMIFF